jgi:acyl carrier protein
MNEDLDSNKNDIKKIIVDFILKNFIFNDKKEDIDENISLYEKGIIDSTGVLELVDFLEERFNIKIEDEELVPDNLDTIKRIYLFVQRKIENVG